MDVGRVVEIWVPAVGRVGTGYLLADRLVLTSWHVVRGIGPDGLVEVRPWGDEGLIPWLTARLCWPWTLVNIDAAPEWDAALLVIDDPHWGPAPPLAPARFGQVSGQDRVACLGLGFPDAEARPDHRRDTMAMRGHLDPLQARKSRMLTLHVDEGIVPRRQKRGSGWAGSSGTALFCGRLLVGVLATDRDIAVDDSVLGAVPISALEALPGFRDTLRAHDIELRLEDAHDHGRPEPAYWATLREFGRALHQRMPQLLDRKCELAEITAFATSAQGYRWLVGKAFAGKTALLYEAVTIDLPDEVDAVCYFLSRRASDASGKRFLAAVVPQLAYLCDVDPPAPDLDQYYALWEEAATRAGRHLLLVVDGLDEDLLPHGSPSVASMLPTMVGAHAHVLVTSRPYPKLPDEPHPRLPDDVPDGHPLRVVPIQLAPFKGAQELADLARKEIKDLTHGDDPDLAVDILGVLTAAAGPLSLKDLVALRSDGHGVPTPADTRHVRQLVEDHAARSLERVDRADDTRYQFAHSSLLEYAQTVPDLCHPDYRRRIHRWAKRWQAAGWPIPAGGEDGTPQYLLDTYPSILTGDPPRLAAQTDLRRLVGIVSDIGWVDAAIQTTGVDSVVAALAMARSAAPARPRVSSMLAAVRGQARHLRAPHPVHQPGYVLRQLCLQAAELGEELLAVELRNRLLASACPDLVPQWTSRRANRALLAELDGLKASINAVTVLPDGRVVSGGANGRVLMWDPAAPNTKPTELGRHHDMLTAMAAAEGRVVSGGRDGRVLMWDPAAPNTKPTELGRHDDTVTAVAAAEGRVVSGGRDGRVLMWDSAAPGAVAAELGHHDGMVTAVAVTREGQVVSGGTEGHVLMWDPAAPNTKPTELDGHDGAVLAVAALPNGRVISGGRDGRVLMLDPAAPNTKATELGRHHGGAHAAVVLPDGLVVSGGHDRRVRMWDPAAPGAVAAELGRHDGMVTAVAVTREGQVVSGGTEGHVLMWDPAAPQPRSAGLGHHDRRVSALTVTPDGRVVSGGRDGQVLMWDPAAPNTEPTGFDGHQGAVRALVALSDGRVISVGQDRWLLVWDPDAPGAVAAKVGKHGGAALAAWPDGRVVSGGHDGRVLIWNPAKPQAGPTELGCHNCTVTEVAVLPSGRVVSGGTDGRVLMWDPDAPEAVADELGRHDGWVKSVAVLPDGRVVSSGTDGRVRVWAAQGQAAPGPVACHAQAIAAGVSRTDDDFLALAHKGGGMSIWLVAGAAHKT